MGRGGAVGLRVGKPKRGRKMTEDRALQWVAFATRQPVEKVVNLGLAADQLVTLAKWFEKHPLLNPPKTMPVKRLRVLCQCGCGEWFERDYTTGQKPKYMNATHRVRAARARRRERES